MTAEGRAIYNEFDLGEDDDDRGSQDYVLPYFLLASDYEFVNISSELIELPAVIEYVVSMHILEDRSTSTAQSLRAVKEAITSPVRFIAGAWQNQLQLYQNQFHRWHSYDLARSPGEYIFLSQYSNRILPNLLMTLLSSFEAAHATTIEVSDALYRSHEAPERTLQQVQDQLDRPTPRKSPWADALGPLYTSTGLAAVLNMPVEQLKQSVELGALCAIPTEDGETLFPVAQVTKDGHILRGLQWIILELRDLIESIHPCRLAQYATRNVKWPDAVAGA